MGMPTVRRPRKQFLVSLFLLFAVSLLGWRLAPWQMALWLEPGVTPLSTRPDDGERIDPRTLVYQDSEVLREHLAQYEFAKKYSQEHNFHSVADIASGTCYGMEILKQVVPVVDGYDKLDLCGNYVIDLDKEDWNRKYDAIVSFETVEHLANPGFFLANAARSAPVLILSTPVNEGPGNHFHLQHWSNEEFQKLLESYYTCEYLHRVGDAYELAYVGGVDFFAVCTRREGNVTATAGD